MRAALLAILLCSCNIPTTDDVRSATSDAVDQCRQILEEEIPTLVQQIAGAAVAACGGLSGQISMTREQVTYDILAAMGCSWDGRVWDCQYLCPTELP